MTLKYIPSGFIDCIVEGGPIVEMFERTIVEPELHWNQECRQQLIHSIVEDNSIVQVDYSGGFTFLGGVYLELYLTTPNCTSKFLIVV